MTTLFPKGKPSSLVMQSLVEVNIAHSRQLLLVFVCPGEVFSTASRQADCGSKCKDNAGPANVSCQH